MEFGEWRKQKQISLEGQEEVAFHAADRIQIIAFFGQGESSCGQKMMGLPAEKKS